VAPEATTTLDGLIILDKPAGLTSAQAVYRVRRITGQRKSGHAGTLDPAATGVLVLCLGRATKLVEAIMDQPKVYRATARLDVTSVSFDADRPLTPVPVPPTGIPSAERVAEALREFEGTIAQVPPAISAVKIGGVPAYRRARRDETVVLAPRPVHIYWLHLHAYDWPHLDFELACGRGTYVRALIRDLGTHLTTGGCLTSLVRRQVGPFTLDTAWSLDKLTAATAPEQYLIDLDRARSLLTPETRLIPRRPGSE